MGLLVTDHWFNWYVIQCFARAIQASIRAARLCQRARLLQLAALELHCADLAVQSATCKDLLEVFFLPAETDDDTGNAALSAA